jgi:hypothetical protein
MIIYRRRRNSGLTLVELSVSIGLTAFIFGALAYLIFMTGRNSFLVRDQSLSQAHSAAAAERITNTLRNSRYIGPYGTDDISTTLTRLVYELPNGPVTGGIDTGVVAFVPSTDADSSDGVIKMWDKASDYHPGTYKTDKASREFRNIQKFQVVFHSNSWVTLVVSYNYRGFSLDTNDSDGDGIADSRLAGEFISDAIAKNHHPGESAHYAETTNTLFQL